MGLKHQQPAQEPAKATSAGAVAGPQVIFAIPQEGGLCLEAASASEKPLQVVREGEVVAKALSKASATEVEIAGTSAASVEAIVEVAKAAREDNTTNKDVHGSNATLAEQLNEFRAANAADAAKAANEAGAGPTVAAEDSHSMDGHVEAASVADDDANDADSALRSWLWSWSAPSSPPPRARANSTPSLQPPATSSAESSPSVQPPPSAARRGCTTPPATRSPAKPSAAESVEREVVVNEQQHVEKLCLPQSVCRVWHRRLPHRSLYDFTRWPGRLNVNLRNCTSLYEFVTRSRYAAVRPGQTKAHRMLHSFNTQAPISAVFGAVTDFKNYPLLETRLQNSRTHST